MLFICLPLNIHRLTKLATVSSAYLMSFSRTPFFIFDRSHRLWSRTKTKSLTYKNDTKREFLPSWVLTVFCHRCFFLLYLFRELSGLAAGWRLFRFQKILARTYLVLLFPFDIISYSFLFFLFSSSIEGRRKFVYILFLLAVIMYILSILGYTRTRMEVDESTTYLDICVTYVLCW